MRVIADIPHPDCKISIFYLNQKYIVKVEQGKLEQSYKISELDYIITGVEDVKKVIDENFIKECLILFKSMKRNLDEALKDF